MAKDPFEGLPPFAVEFLHSRSSHLRPVRIFHGWLKGTYRPLLDMKAVEFEPFFALLAKAHANEAAQRLCRRRALAYFDWLHQRALLRFDPRCAWPRYGSSLPPEVSSFLRALAPTLKSSTLNIYKTHLRQFHIWLTSQSVSLAQLERQHMTAWLEWIHARGLHAATRLAAIQNVRSYLRWLNEQAALQVDADSLLRSSDLPKLPQYLPRPLPVEVDEKLQARFKKSRCQYQLGLLLMRRTGLRVSELRNMSFDCLWTDPKGATLLKVPLGKLNNERLVPLDPATVKLVRKLQRRVRRKRALLVQTEQGLRTPYAKYREALAVACRGLSPSRITTHQLRHTYATALLAGGMSLPSLMRLLGHRDYRMTLRYAAITDETVLVEYDQALRRNEQRYQSPAPAMPDASSPAQLVADAARQLQKRAKDDNLDADKTRDLVNRLRRLHTRIASLLRSRRKP